MASSNFRSLSTTNPSVLMKNTSGIPFTPKALASSGFLSRSYEYELDTVEGFCDLCLRQRDLL